MINAITAEARDGAGITVEVRPGGGLRSITMTDRSMRLGSDVLASTILGLVRTATAHANQRARFAVAEELGGSGSEAIGTELGLGVDADLADAVELTTPDTWMR